MSIRRRRQGFIGGLTIRTGLQLWLDAADTSTITSSGGDVSAWADKSGNGNNATQGTASARPTTGATTQNERNVLDFDGSDTLILPSALYSIPNGNNTEFVVVKRNTETGSAETFLNFSEGGSPNSRLNIGFATVAGNLYYQNRTDFTNGVFSTGNINTDMQIVTTYRSGVTQSISVNGGSATTNALALSEDGIDAAHIGSRYGSANFLIGSICEIIIFDRELSDPEKTVVEQYLAAKWGITLV